MKRYLLVPILIALAAVIGIVGKIYVDQDAAIFPRRVNQVAHPDPAKAPFEELVIKAPGADLSGIFFPGNAPSPTLLIAFGGNAHDPIGFASFLKNDVFAKQNVAVAAFSYRGYPNALGKPSTGTPTEKNLRADAILIYDTMARRVSPSTTVAIGYSLGTAVATQLATHRPLSRLILVAPPASIRRMGQEKYPFLPVSLLVKYPFATEDILPSVAISTTIIYTPTDGLIPAHHIEILQRAQPAAQLIELTDTDHSNILHHPALPQHLREILAQPLQP